MSNIKDIALAPSGELKIDWVKRNCPLLRTLEGEFAAEKPFAGLRIALSVHLEAKTAYLCRVLAAGGKVGGFSAPGGSISKVKMLALEGVSFAPPAPAQQSFGF